jgi:tRNA (cmo5U34)-methyltransferase
VTWQFNSSVAVTFVDHARQHIPNYDLVIDKCVSVCEQRLKKSDKIIDVGCATGETLRRLNGAGFNNLTGVESSSDMLQYCDDSIASLVHSNQFPNKTFDGVLCNWTLHFVKNKKQYLSDIYHNLNKNGLFILSEKTSLDPVAINFYHRWKHEQGVSWKDIEAKEAAIKDIMYINSPSWYIDTLNQLGFRNIQIIDASWCFTSFMAIK